MPGPEGQGFLGVPVPTQLAGLGTSGNINLQENRPVMVQPSSSDLAAITVSSRVAQFWRDMPKLWFTQFEAILAPQKLGQEAKFDLVISKLGKEELNTVGDLLENATGRNYEALKARLITAFQESADMQFNKLVKEMELGEQKPSQLYRRMAEAARNANVADSTLRKLWVQRLPAAIRAILSTLQEGTKLEDMVSMADKIMESFGQGIVASVAASADTPTASHSAVPNDLMYEFRNMVLEVKQLRGEVSELRSRETSRRSFEGRSRSRSKSGHRARNPNWLCKYHFRYRENAKRCFQPCAWGRQQSAGAAPPASYPRQSSQGN